jgi:phospholipase/lecithinase/hemolysin
MTLFFSFSKLRSGLSAARILIFVPFLIVRGVANAETEGTPAFTKVVVFGDSLSDVGNVQHRMEDDYIISYPSGKFNYSDGRFTNSSDTDPGSVQFVGVWHEQLARTFLGLPAATASLNGGNDYAFGGATTKEGASERTIISNPDPFIGGSNTLTIDNMGRQIDDYLNQQMVDPGALYVVWGGGNDLFDDATAANVPVISHRVVGLVNRLIMAGAKHILAPNVPPLGGVPLYSDDGDRQFALNRAASEYRATLNADLDANLLLGGDPPAIVYRVDIWSLVVRTLSNPMSYGFTDVLHSAQGNSSANPDNYLYWDDIHPTTAGHFQIAQEAARVLAGDVVPPARAVNVSSRVTVGQGENNAIGGFIITGSAPRKVMVRAIGPSLTSHGVPGALSDPIVSLFDQSGALIATNDNWEDSQRQEIIDTGIAPTDRLESAILRTLPPGAYTAVMNGAGSSAGIGLVEIYDVDTGSAATVANLSTRGFVGTGDNVLIGGLIIRDGANPLVVLRAIGPSLTASGVGNALLDPTLELYDSNGMQIGRNDNWRDGQPAATKATVLAPTDDREATMVVSLAPGAYTAIVRGQNDTTGMALVEAFRLP